MRFSYLAIVTLLFCQLSRALAAPPPNDNFLNAILLTGTNVTVTGTNVGATHEIGEPNHGAPGGSSVWWTWTAPGNGSVVIQTTGSSFDTLLAVYTATDVNDLADSIVASNDDSGSAQTSLVAFDVTPGSAYHIVVDGYNGTSGTVQLQLNYRTNSIPPVPPNDNFATRTPLQGLEVSVAGENFFATKEPGEPNHAEELGGASVWWSWMAPISATVQVDTAGSDFDTLLAVYQGAALTNLTTVTASDDARTNTVTSLVTFDAVAGMNYAIAVDGFDGQPGDIQLHIQTAVVLLGNPQVLADGTRQFTLTGPFGPYAIERSSDLVTWERLSTVSNENGSVDVSEPENSATHYFYRAVQLP